MKCPNCNNEMKDKSYWFYGIGEWDCDYPCSYHEEYNCAQCKNKWVNDKWEIPEHIPLATLKQQKMVDFINHWLHTNYNPILKYSTIKFISENVDAANQAKKDYQEVDNSDDWDWQYAFDEPF